MSCIGFIKYLFPYSKEGFAHVFLSESCLFQYFFRKHSAFISNKLKKKKRIRASQLYCPIEFTCNELRQLLISPSADSQMLLNVLKSLSNPSVSQISWSRLAMDMVGTFLNWTILATWRRGRSTGVYLIACIRCISHFVFTTSEWLTSRYKYKWLDVKEVYALIFPFFSFQVHVLLLSNQPIVW